MRGTITSVKSPTGIHPHSNPLSGTLSASSSHKQVSKQIHPVAGPRDANSSATPTITTSNHGHSGSSNTTGLHNHPHTHLIGNHSIANSSPASSKSYQGTPSSGLPPQAPSSRRIWIKRAGGTPTTFTITKTDIIDDLKSAVLRKFGNSLGRVFDSADLVLKMDLLSRLPTNINSGNSKPGSTTTGGSTTSGSFTAGRLSPEPPRSRVSSSNLTKSISSSNPSTANNHSLVKLEPDQNVWAVIEHYYPLGMSMNECLIVDTPELPDLMYGQLQPGDFSYQQRALQYGNYQQPQIQLLQVLQQLLQQPQLQLNALGREQQSANPMKPPLFPVDQSGSTANLSNSNTPLYYQPKPQNLYLNKSLANSNQGAGNLLDSMGKDRSISPSTLQSTASPLAHHRRAHSNPPQSPLHYSSTQHSSSNNHSSNSNPGQAILLLPKNFSLTSGGSDGANYNYSDKKRMSFDDGYLKRNRNLSLKPSHLGTNITNIGMGITSPTSTNLVSYVSIPENDSFKSPNSLEFDKKVKGVDNLRKTITSPNQSKNDQKKNQLSSSKEVEGTESTKAEGDQKKLAKEGCTENKNQEKEVPSKPVSSSGKPNNLVKIQSAETSKAGSNNKNSGTNNNNNNSTTGNQFNMKQQSKSTTERVLPSISVLVVEDNAINQAILGAFLRKHKIHYQIAKNGQEAIDKWRQGGFHLVLMDIQLPVKSGIEATKEIRHLEKVNRIGVFAENELINTHYSSNPELKREEHLDLNVFRSPVIIVALTASSNSSTDKKKALMAGCNDYLTKPVNLVWLQNKITEWGCMQALIDFDGWDRKRVNTNEKKTLKVANPRSEKGVLLEGPAQIKTSS